MVIRAIAIAAGGRRGLEPRHKGGIAAGIHGHLPLPTTVIELHDVETRLQEMRLAGGHLAAAIDGQPLAREDYVRVKAEAAELIEPGGTVTINQNPVAPVPTIGIGQAPDYHGKSARTQ